VRPLLVCLLTLLLAGCSGVQALNTLSPGDYTRDTGIVYDHKHDLALDIYRPDGARRAPVIVFFYGGSWQDGSRSEYRFVGAELARQGFVTVIPDYRLFPQVRYPSFVEDCARAVAWTHAHVAEHGGDARRIVLLGHSAGAYNAAMLALDPRFLRQAGGSRRWIRGMIGLGGPYDFLPLTSPDLKQIFGPREQRPLTQPIHWVDGTNPPMLLIDSHADHTVLPKNTVNLYHRIRAAGGPVEMKLYDGLSHRMLIGVVSRALSWHSSIVERIDRFTRRVTANPG
jgi:Esterase/lipase